ncbi:MAG: UDP-3-O-[3-hydroxymyristoyl] N-acetylglucosamine deacetylase [Candidatus Rokubacteria bacterium]|nr:UDP-3-O-[3-hydroxymyristoyl] N-acetylglucosamine deacetylase [Candidatus Rokubacteria bacterium]
MQQRTIKKPVVLEGIGLHSGKPVRMVVAPAPVDAGIVFRANGEVIPAAPESVVDSRFATTLGRNGTRIRTVEHLMAAAVGLGYDNLDVQVEGPELPAADGSAKPFVALLQTAGRQEQGARRRPIALPHPIRVGEGHRWISIVPSSRFRISYTLDNDHPAIGTQVLSWDPSERTFVEELAPARTYGFLKDIGTMRKNGLARGGSLENAVVVGKRGPINGLRYRDEYVRHKVLDLVGDLALLGRPLLGHVIARNAGHDLNFALAVAVQRALGLERRAVPSAARVARAATARADGFLPVPGLAVS